MKSKQHVPRLSNVLFHPPDLPMVARCSGSSMRACPPVPSEDVVEAANGADCGLWSLPNLCKNFSYALPNKVFEYLHAGLPVLAADYPEVRKLVAGYGVGLLFDPYDPRSIAAAVRRLHTEPGLAETFRGRIPHALADLDAGREWDKLVDIYRALEPAGDAPSQPLRASAQRGDFLCR